MQEDPRRGDGAFRQLMDDMRACKERRTCPELTTRALYFEPNPATADAWAQQGRFVEPIDWRVVFVCESPSNWPGRGESTEPAQCFVHAGKGERFQRILKDYGLANCYQTNAVKCGPRRGARHTETEIRACTEFLIQEIRLIEPVVVVGVGKKAKFILDRHILPNTEPRPLLHLIDHFSARLGEEGMRAKWKPQFEALLGLLQAASTPGQSG